MHPAIPMKMRRKERVTHEIHPQASTERASEQVLPKHQPQLVYLLDRAAAPPRKSAQTTKVAVNSMMSEPNGHSLARAYERKTQRGRSVFPSKPATRTTTAEGA